MIDWTKALEDLRQQHLFRDYHVVDQRHQQMITVQQQSYINFCSNDYLGLSTHPFIKQAFIQAVDRYGFGSTASPQVTGYFLPHIELEQRFAEFLGRERALLFSSGYVANIGVMQALLKRKDSVFADRLCHASILDGVQLSRAKLIRYQHNDMNHLASLMANDQGQQQKFIISESVFSMEGDICHAETLLALAKQHQASLILDDAHGIGVLGERGAGIAEFDAIDPVCLITPLGKAFAGMGAIVSGSNELIETVYQFARSHRYSTALPPAVAAANIAALKVVSHEAWRRQQLQGLIQYSIEQAQLKGLQFVSNDLTPIKSIIIGDEKQTLWVQQQLAKKGFCLSCIRPPTVPKGSARIRLSLSCLHQRQDIDRLLDALSQSCEALDAA